MKAANPTIQTSPFIRRCRGVIGVISRRDRHLLIRRAIGVPKGGHWCFPGGHVERGETSRRAVTRELAEELGITVVPIARIGAIRVSESGYVLVIWRVRYVSGSIALAPAEVADVRWCTPCQARSMRQCLASTASVLELLRRSDVRIHPDGTAAIASHQLAPPWWSPTRGDSKRSDSFQRDAESGPRRPRP